MITKKLREEFPGIYALFGALKRVWEACLAYNKAIKAVSVIVVAKPTNEWAYAVSKSCMLSYEEALYIYKFITEESDLYMRAETGITEFVIERANCGYKYYVIMEFLAEVDKELDKWTRDKLRMPS